MQEVLYETGPTGHGENEELGGRGGRGGMDRTLIEEEVTALLANQAGELENSIIMSENRQQITISKPTADGQGLLSERISLVTSRISSTGVAIGYLAGVSILILTLIPVTLLQGSLFSLRLAVCFSGIWWAVFTLPAGRWLSGTETFSNEFGEELWNTEMVKEKVKEGWMKLGEMVRGGEIERLKSTYWYLLAWALLADGELELLKTGDLYASILPLELISIISFCFCGKHSTPLPPLQFSLGKSHFLCLHPTSSSSVSSLNPHPSFPPTLRQRSRRNTT